MIEFHEGDRVEAGESGLENHDTGTILFIAYGIATVDWDNGVQTVMPLGSLRHAK